MLSLFVVTKIRYQIQRQIAVNGDPSKSRERNLWQKPVHYVQSWTKVLGQTYICGAFSHAPNKFIDTCSAPPPPPLLQCWTRVNAISPEFQH